MSCLDILFIGSVMDYGGASGSPVSHIRRGGKWVAPFQFIREKLPALFSSDAAACLYGIPTLGVCKLVDHLKRRGELSFRVVWHFDYAKEEVLSVLRETPPRLVAVSTTPAISLESIESCVAWINRHKSPSTKVIVGGKKLYSEYLRRGPGAELERRLPEADYLVFSIRGEDVLHRVLEAERAGEEVPALPGLARRRGGRLELGRPDEEPGEPGPMIDFSSVGAERLGDIVQVRTAESCPYRCRFCMFPAMEGRYRPFELDEVLVQLRRLKEMGVRRLLFVDDTLNVPASRFEELLDRMIREKLDMTWAGVIRLEALREGAAEKMREAGCLMAACGIESGNDAILRKMGKDADAARYDRGLELLSRAGIRVAALYFVGYPGETRETAMDTLRMIRDPRIAYSRGGTFIYDPTAPVARMAEEFKLTGAGRTWRHETMGSAEAERIYAEMLLKLDGINLSGADGGSWSLFRLHCLGAPFDELDRHYLEFSRIQRSQLRELAGGAPPR